MDATCIRRYSRRSTEDAIGYCKYVIIIIAVVVSVVEGGGFYSKFEINSVTRPLTRGGFFVPDDQTNFGLPIGRGLYFISNGRRHR